jgi:hypothetical protein
MVARNRLSSFCNTNALIGSPNSINHRFFSLSANSMAFPAALALDLIDGQLGEMLNLHRFDRPSRTKTRLFSIGSPSGKQFALIIGDLDSTTQRPKSLKTVIVLPKGHVPAIDGVTPLYKDYKTSRLRQADSKLCPPRQRGIRDRRRGRVFPAAELVCNVRGKFLSVAPTQCAAC